MKFKCWEGTRILRTVIKDYFFFYCSSAGRPSHGFLIIRLKRNKDIHPPPPATKIQLVQSSLILSALLQAISLVSPNPLRQLCPPQNTPVWGHPGYAETSRELHDPATLNIKTEDNVFSKIQTQGSSMGCANRTQPFSVIFN